MLIFIFRLYFKAYEYVYAYKKGKLHQEQEKKNRINLRLLALVYGSPIEI